MAILKDFYDMYNSPNMERVLRCVAIIRVMVNHVDYLIAYTWHPASNAGELMEYATACTRYILQNYLIIIIYRIIFIFEKITNS